jgi:hypoxanthine phosphoribosyltransferase
VTPARARRLVSREEIAAHVERIAAQITIDYPDGVVLVGVLRGALLFLADLARAITEVPVEVDFLAISRYAPDSGRVRILQDVSLDLTDRDVIVVEDLVDTGLSAAYLIGHCRERGARSVALCAFLDRSVRRILPIEVKYTGVAIADVFVLGYGLHYADRFRNLQDVWEAARIDVEADPEGLSRELYGV